MGSAQTCTCSHVMTDHLVRSKDSKSYRSKCEWWDCTCEKFKYNKTTQVGRISYKPKSPLIVTHNRSNYIGELRDDGTIIRR